MFYIYISYQQILRNVNKLTSTETKKTKTKKKKTTKKKMIKMTKKKTREKKTEEKKKMKMTKTTNIFVYQHYHSQQHIL